MRYLVTLYTLLFLSTFSTIAQETGIQKNEDSVDEQSDSVEDVPFAIIEDVPIFPGCESFEKSKRRQCFNDQIINHIREHFRYPEEAIQKDLQGRVNLMFFVHSDGSINNIKTLGPHPILEKEAERIISLLPNMVPGMQKGKAVRVPFSIPITFKLPKKESTFQNTIPIDSLDVEPKFLDYSFLNPRKNRRQRRREELSSETEMKNCIQRHLSNQFRYPESAQQQKIQGRIEIELIATKEGKLIIREIIGENQILKEEAFRMVSLFPKQIIPGKKDGKIVNTSIKFPLTFKLQ